MRYLNGMRMRSKSPGQSDSPWPPKHLCPKLLESRRTHCSLSILTRHRCPKLIFRTCGALDLWPLFKAYCAC